MHGRPYIVWAGTSVEQTLNQKFHLLCAFIFVSLFEKVVYNGVLSLVTSLTYLQIVSQRVLGI